MCTDVRESDFEIRRCHHLQRTFKEERVTKAMWGRGTEPLERSGLGNQYSDFPILWEERGRRVPASIADGATQQRPGFSMDAERWFKGCMGWGLKDSGS